MARPGCGSGVSGAPGAPASGPSVGPSTSITTISTTGGTVIEGDQSTIAAQLPGTCERFVAPLDRFVSRRPSLPRLLEAPIEFWERQDACIRLAIAAGLALVIARALRRRR